MKILFLCVANSARSQMAEALAKNILPESFEIQSAGSLPSGKVHQDAITAINELGLNMSKHTSKSIDDLPVEFIEQVDYVITLCADEVCPMFMTRAQKLHWPLSDPAAANENERLESFRVTRDNIKAKLEGFNQKKRDK